MVKAVIFDLWGTLVETGVKPSPTKQVKYFLRARDDFSEFVHKFEDSFMKEEFESLKDGFENVVNEFDLRIPDFVYDKMIGMWNKNSILAKPYDDLEVLKEFKEKGYKVFVLANIDKFSYEQLKQKIDFKELIDKAYLSYETGVLKSEGVFEIIAKENKIKKEDMIMVGDSLKSDVENAENEGVKAVLMDRRDRREYENKVKDLNELLTFITRA